MIPDSLQIVVFVLGLVGVTYSIIKNERYLIVLLFAFVVLGQLARLPIPISDIGILSTDILLLYGSSLWFGKQLFLKHALPKSNSGPYIIGFLCVLLVSILIALPFLSLSEWIVSFSYLVRYAVYLLYFYICIAAFKDYPIKQMLKHLLYVATTLGMLGIIQFLFVPDFTFMAIAEGWDPHIGRLLSTWFDPNFVAGFFAVIIALYSSIWLYKKHPMRHMHLPLFIAFLSICFLLTYSRSGIVALAIAIAVIGILKFRMILVVSIIGLLLGIQVSERFSERFYDMVNSGLAVATGSLDYDVDLTSQERLASWTEVGALVDDHWLLGIGYNTIKYRKLDKGIIADPNKHDASGSDSSLLNVYITSGIIGVLFFLSLWYKWSLLSFQLFISKKTPDWVKGFALGMLAMLTALLFHSLFVNSLFYPLFLLVFIPLIAGVDYLHMTYLSTTADNHNK